MRSARASMDWSASCASVSASSAFCIVSLRTSVTSFRFSMPRVIASTACFVTFVLASTFGGGGFLRHSFMLSVKSQLQVKSP